MTLVKSDQKTFFKQLCISFPGILEKQMVGHESWEQPANLLKDFKDNEVAIETLLSLG